MKHLVLIDGNNWGFAGNGKRPIYSGLRKVQAVHYFLNRIEELYLQYPKASIMVLWDGRSWRHDIYSEYKANREATEQQIQMKKQYEAQKPYIQEALKLLGITQVTYSNWEADDLAYTLTTAAVRNGMKVTLYTADEDWQQLVQQNVSWYDVIRDKSCNFGSFKKDTGFINPAQFIEAKCILGDRGDNVLGINGIGIGTLNKIYQIWESATEFIQWDGDNMAEHWLSVHGKKLPKVLAELDVVYALSKIENNMKLVNLATSAKPKPTSHKRLKLPIDEAAFKTFCIDNCFFRASKNLKGFLKTFEGR